MEIQLSHKHRLRADDRCYILDELTIAGKEAKEPGKESWGPVAYFGDLKSALTVIPERIARVEDIDTLKGLVERIKYYQQMITQAF